MFIEKWKILLFLLIFTSTIVGAVYISHKQDSNKSEFSKKQQCRDLGLLKQNELDKETEKRIFNDGRYLKTVEEFFYSPKMDSCLAQILENQTIGDDHVMTSRTLVDLLTNKNVEQYIYNPLNSIGKSVNYFNELDEEYRKKVETYR